MSTLIEHTINRRIHRCILTTLIAAVLAIVCLPAIALAEGEPGAPTNLTITHDTLNGITLSWTPGDGSTTTVIRGEQGEYPSSPDDGYLIYNDTGSSCNIDALEIYGQDFYFRAWGHNEAGYSASYAESCILALAADDDSTVIEDSISLITGYLDTALKLLFIFGLCALALWRDNVLLYLGGFIAGILMGFQLFDSNVYIGLGTTILGGAMLVKMVLQLIRGEVRL